MLKSIDILIGIAVVMLVVSAAVTALTQFILHVRESRGKKLKEGVADLLQLIAPNFERTCAESIAEGVLKHPLVRGGEDKLSDTIHREELVKILLELSVSTGKYKLPDNDRRALLEALKDDKIDDPAKILENARSLLLQLEISHPEMSNTMRTNLALLQEAASPFLAKIHAWFDQTMDRTTDRFTVTARKATFACAVAVVLFLQLDTIALINQLSMDSQLRNTLVQEAMRINSAGPSANPGAPATAQPAAATPPQGPATVPQSQPSTPRDVQSAVAQLKSDLDANKDQIRDLASLGLFRVPTSVGEWAKEFNQGNIIMKISGLFLSVVLLSLGAPFWYNALKQLIGLRSLIAGKDDQERKERQTLTAESAVPAVAVGAAAGAGAGATAIRGERGFLG